ncbi:MAG: HAD-IIB family hydrolase [Pseudomonadota bacterium]
MINDSPLILIFTDLDGTLLDHMTYGWKEAEPALNLCRRLNVPVILASSKTRAEIIVLWQLLNLIAPFISENGGGIFFPAEKDFEVPSDAIRIEGLWKWSLGVPYDQLVKALKEIREELEWNLRGFSDMTPEEISRLTGLELDSSILAAKREYDEPFIIDEGGDVHEGALYESARRRGLDITRGGRFYHLKGRIDKGEAVGKVISWYQGYSPRVLSIALGDSPNDFSMLERADYPVLVRSLQDFEDIEKIIPRVRVTRERGPKGWNTAVLEILGDITSRRDLIP